jgi:DNA-binding NarL/FixJ family response regulator
VAVSGSRHQFVYRFARPCAPTAVSGARPHFSLAVVTGVYLPHATPSMKRSVPRIANVVAAGAEPLARCGLLHLLNSHPALRVCAEAECTPSARAECARWKPDVLAIDGALTDSFTMLRDLPRWSPKTRWVIFSGPEDPATVQRAFKAGACGYVTRRDPMSAILSAILGAVHGERHIGPRVEHVLLQSLASGGMELRASEFAALSNRELQIFQMIGAGRGTRDVAEELHVSVKTVETHRQRMKEKLGLSSAAELQRKAVLFHNTADQG